MTKKSVDNAKEKLIKSKRKKAKNPTKKRKLAIIKARWETRKLDAFAIVLSVVVLASIIVAGLLLFKIFKLQIQNVDLHTYNTDTIKILNSTKVKLQDAEDIILSNREQMNGQVELIQALRKQINGMETPDERDVRLENMMQGATAVAAKLKRLSEVDKHVLAKYSKVYFLNEHYAPSGLAAINKKWLANGRAGLRLHRKADPFLDKMFKTMYSNGLSPRIVSAYRSFAYQSKLKAKYKKQYGSGANAFSADQGFSEHQLGTTVDITHFVDKMELFEKTGEYAWMQKNAYKYGFVLSYPKSNTYYTYEPWHWRFVGVALATRLHNENKHFYDLSQREINKYLLNMFE